MALLIFPTSPFNGQIYPDPSSAPVGTNFYRWNAATNTWVLIGDVKGVVAGTYGSPAEVAKYTVDWDGRLSKSENVPIQISATSVTVNPSIYGRTILQDVLQNAVYLSVIAAKGDLIVGAGSSLVNRLTAGTNDQHLVVDSTAPNGLRWRSLPTTVGVADGVSNLGITTITDNTTSSSIDSALSANQGRRLQEQINALIASSNLTFAGTIGPDETLLTVSTEGAAVGFVVGQPLPAPSPTNEDYFVICTSVASITPPGGVPNNVVPGDWFLSDGTTWLFLNIGFELSPATTSTLGGVIVDGETIQVDPAGVISIVTPPEFGFVYFDTLTDAFDGVTTTFTLSIGGVATVPTPTPNIQVFLGGVAQIYGLSYTILDDQIIFSEPPVANTSFVANTIASLQGLGFAYYDNLASAFDGSTTSFSLTIGGAPTPPPNGLVMVYLGGTLQAPGGAYSISGSTITFTEAPLAQTQFMAVTVR